MYKHWTGNSMWAEVQIGWHFGVGFEIIDMPAVFVILPFVRLSMGWL